MIELDIIYSNLDDTLAACDIVVADSGGGIDPEFLPNVFEPFSQDLEKESIEAVGTGLGLSIVKQLVELMGGTIEVESELGRGTSFKIHLVCTRLPDYEPSAEKGRMPQTLAGRHVLLVDDHPLNIELAKQLLEHQGMDVQVAYDGAAALATFEASAIDEIDVILMDVRMPGMDGLEATRRIRALDRPDAQSVPIIAMTANAFDEDVRQTREAGMDAHLSKPIETEEFFHTIAVHLR